MVQLKVTQIGNSVGLVLPAEVLIRLNVTRGDTLYLVESENGYSITAFDPDFAEEMELAEETSHTFRDALKELAQ